MNHRNTTKLLRFAIVAAITSLLDIHAGPAHAAVVVLSPSMDIWTTSVYSYVTGSAGPGGGLNNDQLRVGGWGDEYRSLLQFDLSGAPSSASSATLRLYDMSNNGGTPTAMYLDQVTSSWDWTTQPITPQSPDNQRLWWANRPTYTQIGSLPAPTVGAYTDIDVTALYNAWQSGTANYGVQLRPTNTWNNWNTFASSENATAAWQPQLIIWPATPLLFSANLSVNRPWTCGIFGCSLYNLSFDGSEYRVNVDIRLTGDTPTPLEMNVWETGIHDMWSNRYNIVDGANEYPIVFDANFVSSGGQFVVNVVDGTGRDNTSTWYTDLAGWGNSYQDEAAAHEFGHFFGLYDEYAGANYVGPFGVRCDLTKPQSDPANANCDGLMGDLRQPVQERYFDDILAAINDISNSHYILANAPTAPYPSDQTAPIGLPFEDPLPATSTVDEPDSLALLLISILAMIGTLRRGRQGQVRASVSIAPGALSYL